MDKYLILALLVLATQAFVFPSPVSEQLFEDYYSLKDPCLLTQISLVKGEPLIDEKYYFNKILKRLNNKQDCGSINSLSGQHVPVKLIKFERISPEGYELIVSNAGVEISFGGYDGYVYALESLAQLVGPKGIRFGTITDEPLLEYRGIMIDSVRHFLSVEAIARLIEAMPVSKLNILHWHLSDDETFVLQLESHPELADTSVYSPKEKYSVDNVRALILLAKKNAVKIVPEIDTPAHVRSWGQAPKFRDLTILCPGGEGYNEQFDLSKPEIYDLAKEVIAEVSDLFKDSPYIHLGGDEVGSRCWDQRPQIKKFMKEKNISSYGALQMYWRFQLKQALPKDRKVIFWRNDGTDVSTSDNDVLHFWGSQKDVATVTASTKSSIILSPSDLLYLNKGQGNIWVNTTAGEYSTWRQIYQELVIFPQKVDRSRIIGAEVCLWGEVSSEDTLENNLWMRATAFAEKVWSEKPMGLTALVKRLLYVEKVLEEMGIQPSPITSDFCEQYPAGCFGQEVVEIVEN